MFHIHMLQVYVLNVSFASDVCCIQVFHVASISCFSLESHGGTTRALGEGRGEPGASEWGMWLAWGPMAGRARPYPSSRVSPARTERRGPEEGAVGTGVGSRWRTRGGVSSQAPYKRS
jgi:hypothetical protein